MANFTIPNRPAGSDARHIADIEADFDAVLGNMDSIAAKRQLLGQASIYVPSGTVSSPIAATDGSAILSGVNTTKAAVLWAADFGLSDGTSAQPQDFQISNKSAMGRVRVVVANSTATNFSGNFGITKVTVVAGAGGNLQYTFDTPRDLGTSVVTFGAGTISALESDEFALPVAANTFYGFIAGGVPSSGAYAATIQLFGYNT